jgi:hypothetical protein
LLLAEDWITDGQAGGIFVDLNGGGVTFEFDNFTDKLGVSHTDQLVHGSTAHTIGHHQRPRDLVNEPIVGLLFFKIAHGYDLYLLFSFCISIPADFPKRTKQINKYEIQVTNATYSVANTML